VDAFVAQYPNCTDILGDFTIEGNSINNISGLINLTTVNGLLTIQNTSLTSLNGFQNLNSTYGLEISNNPNLTSIANLLQLNATVYQISISNNPQLTSLFGLNGITSATSLYLVDLPLVISLQPLSGLGGSLPFTYIINLPIQNLIGLNQVTTTTTFNLNNLPNLNSLQGLNQLTDIVIPIPRANDNDYPQEVLGFAFGLSITNTAIANLDELSNLTNMNGTKLSIVNNPNLISLTGLTNLIPTSVGNLEILNNALLSNCATATICTILENIDEDSVFIEVNNIGCTTVLEVENACEALSTSDFNLTNDFKIYPNPFNNHISIALGSDYQNVKITLVDVTGKQFYSKTLTGNTIEINQLDALSSGIYFVTIELENRTSLTKKIVK
ncbi:MAG: T9SS type A sorting domain-containing protein, partial [Flavobacterium sp.]